MKRRTENTSASLDEIRAVYKDLATRPIDRNCVRLAECCNFKLTKSTPYVTKGEAMVAAKAVRAAGRSKMPEREDGVCPLLHPHTSKCLIYENRPFACRTHFCEAAGGPYERKEVLDLIRRIEKVDDDLMGSGPQKIEVAVGAAMRELG